MSTVAHAPRYNHETPEEAGSHAIPTVGHHMGLEPRQPMDPRGWGRHGGGPHTVVGGLGAFPLVLSLLPRQVLACGLPLPRAQRPVSRARGAWAGGGGGAGGRGETRVFSRYRVPQAIDALSD